MGSALLGGDTFWLQTNQVSFHYFISSQQSYLEMEGQMEHLQCSYLTYYASQKENI